ncbi:MAG: hypothetical protein JXM70_07640 [Pirellulales bacterium]|nr:hypothetical protein [Pirellulales bacterium]
MSSIETASPKLLSNRSTYPKTCPGTFRDIPHANKQHVGTMQTAKKAAMQILRRVRSWNWGMDGMESEII